MDVDEAVKIAKQFVAKILKDENVADIGLEEIDFDDKKLTWQITIGYTRPWDKSKTLFAAIAGRDEVVPRRIYRVVAVKRDTGKVVSMRKRDGDTL